MNVEPVSMSCECGRLASAVTQVGLTDDHQLVFHWDCAACGQPVYMFKSLSDCWRECPPREDTPESEFPGGSNIEAEDPAFLGTMGISLPAVMDVEESADNGRKCAFGVKVERIESKRVPILRRPSMYRRHR